MITPDHSFTCNDFYYFVVFFTLGKSDFSDLTGTSPPRPGSDFLSVSSGWSPQHPTWKFRHINYQWFTKLWNEKNFLLLFLEQLFGYLDQNWRNYLFYFLASNFFWRSVFTLLLFCTFPLDFERYHHMSFLYSLFFQSWKTHEWYPIPVVYISVFTWLCLIWCKF